VPSARAVALVLAIACSAFPVHARAADGDAEALIARGIELREQGKDDEALSVFKEAYGRSPSPRARAQVALAEQALGLWVSAEKNLEAALAAGSDSWIAKNRGPLEGALAVIRRHVGSLEVRGTEGAEVFLDGVKLGTLPQSEPFRVEAGRRSLELRAKGFHPTSRSIEIPAGGAARETVQLVSMPERPTAQGGGFTPGERGVTTVDEGRGQRVIGWSFAGAGAALLGAGAVSLLVRKGFIDEYNADATCPGIGSSAPQPARCEDRIESSRTWQTVSLVSFVAGGVFVAGGLTLVLTAPSRRPATAFACAPFGAPAGSGVACSGRF
jgi:hypothetical protein